MHRSVSILIALTVALVGCTTSPGPERDASAGDVGPRSEDAAAGPDGTLSDAASASDGAVRPDGSAEVGSHPPPGARLCGEGTLTQETLRSMCASTDPIVFGTRIEEDCDALTTTGMDYEVWCSTDTLYVFALFREVDSTSRLSCPGSIPLPDGGAIAYETHPIGWGISSPPPDGSPIAVTADGARTTFSAGLGATVSWRQTVIGDPVTGTYERTISSWSRPEGGVVRLDVGGTTTFALALTPVDCTGYTPTGSNVYVFMAQLDWHPPTP